MGIKAGSGNQQTPSPGGKGGETSGEGGTEVGPEGSETPKATAAADPKDPGLSLDGLDPKVQKYIKDLRKESSKHRTRATNLETELGGLRTKIGQVFGAGGEGWAELTPEEQERRFTELGQGAENLQLENQILSLAIHNGISGGEALEYFQFKLQKQLNQMEEGEELDDESIAEIVESVKEKFSAASAVSVTTSVSGKGTPNPEGGDKVSVDDFASMSMAEKSAMFEKNRPLYDKLSAEAKKKRIFI